MLSHIPNVGSPPAWFSGGNLLSCKHLQWAQGNMTAIIDITAWGRGIEYCRNIYTRHDVAKAFITIAAGNFNCLAISTTIYYGLIISLSWHNKHKMGAGAISGSASLWCAVISRLVHMTLLISVLPISSISHAATSRHNIAPSVNIPLDCWPPDCDFTCYSVCEPASSSHRSLCYGLSNRAGTLWIMTRLSA